jgi:glycosyltransferase involved in cell wall biosynthesis
MPVPFVSAVCVTGKSAFHVAHLLPQAVRSFAEQTYADDRRELVVVSDRPLALAEGPRVRIVDAPPGRSLGELRNLGLEAARGDLCMQFDDDDFHPPDRMATQVRACLDHAGAPSFFRRQICYDWTTDTAFIRDLEQTFIHGTICHPRGGARYPAVSREEDTAFLAAWPKQVVLDNDPALYVRFYHGGNTWPRQHVVRSYTSPWALGQWHLGDRHRAYLRQVLDRYPGVAEALASPWHGA